MGSLLRGEVVQLKEVQLGAGQAAPLGQQASKPATSNHFPATFNCQPRMPSCTCIPC